MNFTDMNTVVPKPCIEILFGEKGWHLEKSLFDTEAIRKVHGFLLDRRKALQSRFEEWKGEQISSDDDYARHQAAIPQYETNGLPKDLRHYLTGEFDLHTRLDKMIVQLLGSPRVFAFLSDALASEHYVVHYPPMIRFKVADAPGSVLPAHQDGPYSPHLTDFVTIWVPLVDIDQECGGLYMFDGSHLDGVVSHDSSGPWAYGVGETVKTYPRTHVEMHAGDALIFPALTIHGSAPQRSRSRQRMSIDFRVIRKPEDTTKSYFSPLNNEVVQRH